MHEHGWAPAGAGSAGAGRHEVVVDGTHPLTDEVAAQLRRCRLPVRAGAGAALAAELEVEGAGAAPAAVVLVGGGRVRAADWSSWYRLGVTHLPVAVGAASVVVGPLVVPGAGPCLACAGAAWPGGPPGPATYDPSGSTVLAAAVASVTVLAACRGDRSLVGISTEIAVGDLDVVHRVWKVRDDCRCASVRMAG